MQKEVYGWAEANNMIFNGTKFDHLRYGRGVGDAPLEYVAADRSELVRQMKMTDFGVILFDSERFDEQIDAVVLRSRQLVGWMIRAFATREPSMLLPSPCAWVLQPAMVSQNCRSHTPS